jgi:hypothetical protein
MRITKTFIIAIPLCFQFGRYLMIAGSGPGGQSLNLQGIWNDKVMPPWACQYTLNINAEMNYSTWRPRPTSPGKTTAFTLALPDKTIPPSLRVA